MINPTIHLYGMTLAELEAVVVQSSMPRFVAAQLAEWMYKKNAVTFQEMTNISKANQAKLAEKVALGRTAPTQVQTSVDGTRKYLFGAASGKFIETAMIPDKDRKTVCVSSQVGCKMGCLFCMTARQGFQSHLTSGEILNQYQGIDEYLDLTNIVYMGMGEPLDNVDEVLKSIAVLTADWGFALSPKRITVSTIGIIPTMKKFLMACKCHLAVSMHTPFDEERKRLMPVEQVYPIQDVVDVVRGFDFGLQRRLTFEYIMFEGVNDTPAHVKGLSKLLAGLRCRVNLIKFHPIPDAPLRGCTLAAMEAFRDALNQKGIIATVRASRGEDIFAACGLLSTKALVQIPEADY